MPTPRVVRRRRTIKAGFGLLMAGLLGALGARIYLMRTAPPSAEKMAAVTEEESKILALVNQERARAGRPPLGLSPRLAVIARGHSYDMAIRGYLAHDGPDGLSPAERLHGVGIKYEDAGENIYMEDYRPGLPERAVKGWLASPHHRDNMLSPLFRESGVGVARSRDGKTYVTEDFIR